MRGRQWRLIVSAAALAVTLSGCVQATRHSNAIVFGTNTSLGIKVGPDATSSASINIGYNRQEAVLLPLVANTGDRTVTSNGGEHGQRNTTTTQHLLSPCNVGSDVSVSNTGSQIVGTYPIHPCLLVATNRQATDAYSVLASFGADFSGTVNNTDPTARLGIAQYFSTGMAAQLLATTGGASVTNLNAPPPSAVAVNATANLFGSDVDRARASQLVQSYEIFRRNLLVKIGEAVTNTEMNERILAFEKRVNPSYRLSNRCNTKLDCLTLLSNIQNNPYDSDYAVNSIEFDAAMQNWDSNPN